MASRQARRKSTRNVGRGRKNVAFSKIAQLAGAVSVEEFSDRAFRTFADFDPIGREVFTRTLCRILEPVPFDDRSYSQLRRRIAGGSQAEADAAWKDALAYGRGVVEIKDGVARRIAPADTMRRVHPRHRAKGKQRP